MRHSQADSRRDDPMHNDKGDKQLCDKETHKNHIELVTESVDTMRFILKRVDN